MPAFHLSIPVDDLAEAVAFYAEVLGCETRGAGRGWADVDFHGHRLTLHEAPPGSVDARTCEVDGTPVPVRHFGLVLHPAQWRELADRLVAADIRFAVTPRSRDVGGLAEQHIMFVEDPAGNAIEFTAFPGGVWA